MRTKLWTGPAPEPNDPLNRSHESLIEALSSFFGKPVILYDRAGLFSPFIDDENKIHIFIDSAPVTRQKHASGVMSSRIQTMTSGFGANASKLLRNLACRTSELNTIYTTGPSSDPIAQYLENCIWILVRPQVELDLVYETSSLWDVLVHIALRVRITDGLVTTRFPSELSHADIERILDAHPEARPLPGPLVDSRIQKALERSLDLCGLKRKQYEKEIRHARNRAEGVISRIERATAALNKMRERALLLCSLDRETRLRERTRQEILSILDMPQVEKVSVSAEGSGRLVVQLKPMALGLDKNGNNRDIKVVQPLTVSLALDSFDVPLTVRSGMWDRGVIPHQRGNVCLGNVDSTLRDLLQKGELHSAMQIVIGFLQSYNEQDLWGVSGTYWPAFDAVDVAEGNCVRLKDPMIHEPVAVQSTEDEALVSTIA